MGETPPDLQGKEACLVPELTQQTLDCYARLWQLERWLRRMVYVELRAAEGDAWEKKVTRAQAPRNSDKRLTHMPTPEENLLSYAQLSELMSIISNDWRLFEKFLPPLKIWEAKLQEVSQIRHRVAHFRSIHKNDLGRVEQFLRDIDKGFWTFCTSFNDTRPVLPPQDDPVQAHFLDLDPFPWSPGPEGWSRLGVADPLAKIGVTVEISTRPWMKWKTPVIGQQGFIYCIGVHARKSRKFDYRKLLERTRAVHQHVIFICLQSSFDAFEISIPAVLDTAEIIRVTKRFVDEATDCTRTSSGLAQESVLTAQSLADLWAEQFKSASRAQSLADAWPEYVLGPENPLTFLCSDMPCSFFGA